jgi:hypothetical protein
MEKWLLEFWRVEGVDRKTGIREQGSGIRKTVVSKSKDMPQGLKPRFDGGSECPG